MGTINIVTILVCIGLLVLGAMRGFGKSLKSFTNGIVGIIISVFVCISFGGMLKNVEFASNFIANINNSLGAKAEFLAKIRIGEIVYYLLLFVVVQVARILSVKVIRKVFEAENAISKILNKVFGAIFTLSVVCLFTLLVFAFLAKFLYDTDLVANMLIKLDGSWLEHLYFNNPIRF